jgi:hypothetical protein
VRQAESRGCLRRAVPDRRPAAEVRSFIAGERIVAEALAGRQELGRLKQSPGIDPGTRFSPEA